MDNVTVTITKNIKNEIVPKTEVIVNLFNKLSVVFDLFSLETSGKVNNMTKYKNENTAKIIVKTDENPKYFAI